jgi:hypothetical protein
MKFQSAEIDSTIFRQPFANPFHHVRCLRAEAALTVAQTFLEVGDEKVQKGVLVFVEDAYVIALFESK